MRRFNEAFVGLSALWVLLLPAAAFAASHSSTSASVWGQGFAYLVYRIGSFVCHQRPERSYGLFGVPLPVCARCTGIYVGAAGMALFAATRSRRVRLPADSQRVGLHPDSASATSLIRRVRAVGEARVVFAAAAMPTAATLAYEWTTGWMPAHWIRATSGAVLGAAIAWIVCGARPRASGGM